MIKWNEMKRSNVVKTTVKQGMLLGLLAVSLTGCVVSPFDSDYSNRDHGRYDHGQNDSQRYDRNNPRNDRNHDRPNKPNWNSDHRNDSNVNRPR